MPYLAFLNDRPNKNELYKKVPEEYRHTSGLLYKYLEQFKKADLIPVSAANLILKAPYDPIYHKNWWNLKNIFAKNMIQQKRYSLAYNIAASHNGHCNMDKSDAQWLAGWIALKFLHNPELAYKHFSKMHKIVKKPIGRSRAAYWLGMSTKARKKKEESHKWFREAASLNFTFYGQMAMLELGQTSFTLPPNPKNF
jgi:soluble lytic murein transglycosylase